MKKIASKLMVGLLALGVCVWASGCGTQSQPVENSVEKKIIKQVVEAPVRVDFQALTDVKAGRKNVYAVLKVINGSYWGEVVRGLKEGGAAADCNVYMGGALKETDWETQKAMLDELASKQVDAVVLAPSDSLNMIASAKALRAKNIPVILVDTGLNSNDYDAAFMTNNFFAGQEAAAEMLKMLKDSGLKDGDNAKVALMASSLGSQTLVERVEGVSAYWKEQAPANWKLDDKVLVDFGDNDLAKEQAVNALKDASVKGIITCNNRPTVAAGTAIKESGKKDKILVGFDYAKITAELVADPEQRAATVVQNQYKMGFEGVKTAAAILKGAKAAETFVDTGVNVVNISNYKDYEAQQK